MQVKDLDNCERLCYQDDNCVSLNIKDKDPDIGTHECELNNSTHLEHDGDFKSNPVYYYRGAKVRYKNRRMKLNAWKLLFISHTPYSQMAALLGCASGQTRTRGVIG